MFDLTQSQKAQILDTILQEYVGEHGLGGMSKADFDALLLWLIVRELPPTDSFDLSRQFKIRESRIKSLLETAAVKFDQTTQEQAWAQIIQTLGRVDFDIESLEKGQVRFQLKNPMLYRWLQKAVRDAESTCTYSKASEQVTLNLDVLYGLLDRGWDEGGYGQDWRRTVLADARKDIKKSIGAISKKLAGNELEDLRNRKMPKLRVALENASHLAGIGSLVMPIVAKINS